MPVKNLILIKEKRQFFPFVYKRILGWGVAAIVGLALARYGNFAFLKLIGAPLEYSTEVVIFLFSLPIFFMERVFRALDKREQQKAAKIKFYLAVAGVVGVCALGLYVLSKKSPK